MLSNVNPGLINPKRLFNWEGTIKKVSDNDYWRSTPPIKPSKKGLICWGYDISAAGWAFKRSQQSFSRPRQVNVVEWASQVWNKPKFQGKDGKSQKKIREKASWEHLIWPDQIFYRMAPKGTLGTKMAVVIQRIKVGMMYGLGFTTPRIMLGQIYCHVSWCPESWHRRRQTAQAPHLRHRTLTNQQQHHLGGRSRMRVRNKIHPSSASSQGFTFSKCLNLPPVQSKLCTY